MDSGATTPWKWNRSSQQVQRQQNLCNIFLRCSQHFAPWTELFIVSLLVFALLLQYPAAARRLAPRLSERQVELPNFPFGWVKLALKHDSGRDLLDEVGLDGLTLIRFYDMGLKFSCFGSLLCIVLVPLYHSTDCGRQGFSRYTLANLSCQTGLWLFRYVVVAAYLLNGAFVHYMLLEWQNFVTLRRKEFRKAVLGSLGSNAAQAVRSIMLENIPEDMQSAPKIHEFFERNLGPIGEGEGSRQVVHSTVLQSDTRALHHLSALCDSTSCLWCFKTTARQQLRSAIAEMRETARADISVGPSLQMQEFSSEMMRRRSTVVDVRSPLTGVNLPDFARDVSQNMRDYGTEAARLVHRVTPLAELVMEGSTPNTSTAFVTFVSVRDRVYAEQLLLSHRTKWYVTGAPEARDMVWRNASASRKQIRLRNLLAAGLCVVGVLFWSLPVAGLQAIVNVSDLERWLPQFAEFGVQFPVAYTFIVKYLPVVALMILLTVLPYLFDAIAKRYEMHKVSSDVQRVVLNRYFGYLMATLYVTVLSGSVWRELQDMLNSPASVLDLLRRNVPEVAGYFITFVLARVGISLPLLLLWPGLAQPVHCYFATEAADAALVLVLGLTYTSIAPCMLPVCAVYFAFASVIYRWLFLYVYVPQFESQGAFWYDLFNCSMLGLHFGNISLVALAGGYVGASSPCFYALGVLCASTVAFQVFCRRRYAKPSRHIALDDAVAAELEAEVAARQASFEERPVSLDPVALLVSDYFVDPVLTGTALHSRTSSVCSGQRTLTPRPQSRGGVQTS